MYKGKFNHKAASYFLDLLTKMLKHFETVNTFEIRGASIFCVFDHEKDHYSAKQIDLASVEEIGKADNGFVFGQNNIKNSVTRYEAIRKIVKKDE